MEQRGEGQFIHGEAARRQDEESHRRSPDRSPVPLETQMMVPRKGDAQRDEPADDVGRHRLPHRVRDEADHGQPVDGGSDTADEHEQHGARQAEEHRAASADGRRATAHASRTTICVCADDYGLREGINAAIQHLTDLGRVHAVGALVGAPAWRSGVGALTRMHALGLDVGLHLDLTEYPLVGDVPASVGRLIVRAYLSRLDRSALRAEIRAQLDAFESRIGQRPTFVDGHQHVHQLPGVRDELVAELRERYGGSAPWIRRTRGARRRVDGSGVASSTKGIAIELLGSRALEASVRRQGFRQNRGLLGVYDFAGGAPRYRRLLAGWLGAARHGDLLMCHPGRPDAAGDSLAQAREAEYQVLSSPTFAHLARDLDVRTEPMRVILAEPV